jgi:hypothetical protein
MMIAKGSQRCTYNDEEGRPTYESLPWICKVQGGNMLVDRMQELRLETHQEHRI